MRPRTRCELSELLLANRAGAPDLWQPGYLDERDPFALRPADTGGLPLAENWSDSEARTVPFL